MAIAFVAAANLGNNGGSGNFSANYTTGSGSNRLLCVAIVSTLSTNSDPITAVSYNSVAMTLGAKKAVTVGRWVYLYFLLAPTSGSNAVAVTQTGGDLLIVTAADYTGVQQSAQPDATATQDSGGSPVTTLTTAITIVAANSWAMSAGQCAGAPFIDNTNSVERAQDATFQNLGQADSNADLTAGSNNVTTQINTGGPLGNVVVSFVPFSASSPIPLINRTPFRSGIEVPVMAGIVGLYDLLKRNPVKSRRFWRRE